MDLKWIEVAETKGGLKEINGTWTPFTNILKIDGGEWK